MMEEFQLAAADGTRLYGSHTVPGSGGIRGAVLLIHGLGEHAGRYGYVVDSFTAAGFAVLAYDQRGHGRSPGRRGDASSIAALTDDAAAALAWLRDRWPDTPLFLYGHSMGGGVAMATALRHRPKLAGLILTSPWLGLAYEPPAFKEMLGRAAAKVMPRLTVSAGLGGDALYRNEEKLAADLADPLIHGRISVGTYVDMTEAGRRSIAHAAEWTAPALILHGTADRITSIEASREAAARMGEACRFIAWEGGYHELHNDADRERVLQTVVDWMAEHAFA